MSEKEKILYIEDEINSVNNLKEVTENIGYEVITVDKTEENYNYSIDVQNPIILFMSITQSSPGNSIEIANKIYKKHNIPTIFISEFISKEMFSSIKTPNSFGFLIEPITYIQLKAIIEITIHKAKMEQEIFKDINKFYNIINNSNDPIFIIDTEGKIIFANTSVSKRLGTPINIIKNVHFTDIIIKEDIDKASNAFAKIMIGEKANDIEISYIDRYKKKHTLEITMFPIEKNNKIEGIECIARDITKRKKDEELLMLQYEMAMKLSKTNTLKATLEIFINSVIELDEIDFGSVYLVNKDNGSLDLINYKSLTPDSVSSGTHFEEDSYQAKLANKGILSYIAHDKLKNIDEINKFDSNLMSIVFLPLNYKGKPLALLILGSHIYEEISMETLRVFYSISTQFESVITRIQ